ncbi:MAG: hypothetical protein H5T91_08205 [Synergistetes bacterium]|nr:MAG: hypothetical protein XD52_1326 [bacterium 42_11]MBC7332386.1 hypothetical protein [Synergistota bacterium]MDK2871668.1 hypothetical protein [bacterium]
MRKTLTILLFSLFLAIANISWAQTENQNINSLAEEIKQLFSKGDYKAALIKSRELYLAIWNKSPLFYSKAVLVENEPEGVGLYVERKNNKFTEGDPIYIYVEPMGYTVVKKGDNYSFGLAADFAILDSEGNHLYEKKNFGTWSMESKNFNTEFFLFLRYSFTGIRPGKYRIITTLRDINDPNKKMEVDVPIEIVPSQ